MAASLIYLLQSNQANERANLLQSLSSFFPGKDKADEVSVVYYG